METITFYSYKGGLGRTLALKNYAIFLAKYGFNVCLMDFDLEAPGLHYKFEKYLNENAISGKKGLVDIIFDYQNNSVIPENFDEYLLYPQVRSDSTSPGTITILPAGDSMSNDYWGKLSKISWEKLFYESGSAGDLFFLELKARIKRAVNPDFLLIDSRTGITEVGGICTFLLPDKVVLLICNNIENMEGARLILRNLCTFKRPWAEPIEVIFVLSRFPAPKNEAETKECESIIEGIIDFINEPFTDNPALKIIKHIDVIYSERDLERSEFRPTDIDLLYLKLFLDISPKPVKDKIAHGLKD